MPIKNPKEVFLALLSDVRQSTERTAKFYQEIGELAQQPEIKEALDSRALIAENDLKMIDRCFTLLNEKPVKLSGRLEEMFIEDFRKELAAIEGPVARHLFILAKIAHVTHARIGEFVALIAAADMTGNFGVGVLLETCLADKLVFVDRTRRLIRHLIETKIAEKLVA